MDQPTFNELGFGNIILAGGEKFMVTGRVQDAQGNTQYIAVTRAFGSDDKGQLALLNHSTVRTILKGNAFGEIQLFGETIPATE